MPPGFEKVNFPIGKKEEPVNTVGPVTDDFNYDKVVVRPGSLTPDGSGDPVELKLIDGSLTSRLIYEMNNAVEKLN